MSPFSNGSTAETTTTSSKTSAPRPSSAWGNFYGGDGNDWIIGRHRHKRHRCPAHLPNNRSRRCSIRDRRCRRRKDQKNSIRCKWTFYTIRPDALVLPSRGEGFNLPPAEGMARASRWSWRGMGGIWISLTTAIRSWSSVPMHFRRATSISPNSYWACPSIEQLIRTMKAVYRGGRSPDTTTARKAVQAQSDTLGLRWGEVASKSRDLSITWATGQSWPENSVWVGCPSSGFSGQGAW